MKIGKLENKISLKIITWISFCYTIYHSVLIYEHFMLKNPFTNMKILLKIAFHFINWVAKAENAKFTAFFPTFQGFVRLSDCQ